MRWTRAAATGLALLLIGGVASATIPDGAGVIHGCYLTSGNPNVRGVLRVIDAEAGEACASGEMPLTWNQTGPTGPPGASGISGYQIVTEHKTIEPSSPGQWTPRGRTISAPAGKVLASSGYYGSVGIGGQLFVAYSFPEPMYGGSVWTWGFVCYSSVPCEVDLYGVAVALTP